VEFEQACERIPNGAIVVELGTSAMFHHLHRHLPQSGIGCYSVAAKGSETAQKQAELLYAELFLRGVASPPEKVAPPIEDIRVGADRVYVEDLFRFDHSDRVRVHHKKTATKAEDGNDKKTATKTATRQMAWSRHDNSFVFDLAHSDSWLKDHLLELGGCVQAVVPAALYLFLAAKAVANLASTSAGTVTLANISIQRPFYLDEDQIEFRVRVLPSGNKFEIYGSADNFWAHLACGDYSQSAPATIGTHVLSVGDNPFVSNEGFYDELKEKGYLYGEAFRCLNSMSLERRLLFNASHGTLLQLPPHETWTDSPAKTNPVDSSVGQSLPVEEMIPSWVQLLDAMLQAGKAPLPCHASHPALLFRQELFPSHGTHPIQPSYAGRKGSPPIPSDANQPTFPFPAGCSGSRV
jgi:hypothetical protein